MMKAEPNVIIENRSQYCKIGLSNESEPKSFPCLIGRPKNPIICCFAEEIQFYIGTNAEERRDILNLKHPIEQGIVNDWDDMERIWDYGFTNIMRIEPSEHKVMITEVPFNSKRSRETIAAIMFESFSVSGLYIADQTELSVLGAGKTSGVDVDSRNGMTYIVPVLEGCASQQNVLRFNLGGRDISNYLTILLHEDGISLHTKEIIKEIKEKMCYVALDYEKEKTKNKENKYELPDGTVINLKDYTYKVLEILFHPEVFGREAGGIDVQCLEAIEKIDNNFRKELYQSIILSGGNTLFKGFPERLSKEIKNRVPKSIKNDVNVIAIPGREHIAWKGGSVLSSLSSFQNQWITKEEYMEIGPSIIQKLNLKRKIKF